MLTCRTLGQTTSLVTNDVILGSQQLLLPSDMRLTAVSIGWTSTNGVHCLPRNPHAQKELQNGEAKLKHYNRVQSLQ